MSKDKHKKAARNSQAKERDAWATADRYRAALMTIASALVEPGAEDRSLAFFLIKEACESAGVAVAQ